MNVFSQHYQGFSISYRQVLFCRFSESKRSAARRTSCSGQVDLHAVVARCFADVTVLKKSKAICIAVLLVDKDLGEHSSDVSYYRNRSFTEAK